jgi:hypothetical protein
VSSSPIYPELVTGREDGFAGGPWTVRRGSIFRGEASCNLTERILEVPLGADETSRVVRAHELMHARVSPHVKEHNSAFEGLSIRALECAEELRVNTLVARVGFDLGLLRDGSEKAGGKRLGESGDWAEAVCFLMAVLGTGGEKEYLAGIRQSSPSWLAGLRTLRKHALSTIGQISTSELGSTQLNDDLVPKGYANATMTLARVITESMSVRPPRTTDEVRAFRRSLEPGGRRAPSGQFAALHFDVRIALSARSRSSGVRHVRPSTSGVTMRYPSRLLTDSQRRAFARRSTHHGGIVIIDQSGSMDLDPDALTDLLRRAPNAVILGYSHSPGDRGNTPNAWVLAQRGAVALDVPVGNVGNGVDGPVLAWAIRQRHSRETIVWVTDGQVTDSNDHPDEGLTAECAQLVLHHRVRLVRHLVGAGASLSQDLPVPRSQWREFGRLGRKLLELQHSSMSQG